MKRKYVQGFSILFFKLLTRTTFEGCEYLPPKGGVIVTTNHLSRMDIPLLGANPGRTDITAMVTDKYKDYAFFKWFAESVECIWLDRTKADFTAFAAAIKALRDGRAMGIAPEGTRSLTGQLLEGKAGTAVLASRVDVPLVPVAIMGTETAFEKMRHVQRPRIHVRFGPAYRLPPLDRNDKDGYIKNVTDEIMCRIAVLMPESYHGFYAGHPRIASLRKELNL